MKQDSNASALLFIGALFSLALAACPESPTARHDGPPKADARVDTRRTDSRPGDGALHDIATHDGTSDSHLDTIPSYGASFHVDPSHGDDTNAGTEAHPFATLEGARQAIRDLQKTSPLPPKGIVVWLHGGLYHRNASFTLSPEDSGEPGRPIAYRGLPGAHPRILGSQIIPTSWFTPVTKKDAIWTRLDPTARTHILRADLKAHGISNYGTLQTRGFGLQRHASAMELFVDAKPMTLARWPDIDANDPPQVATMSTLTLYGSLTPDVTGTYTTMGTQDGVNAFVRTGLVGGKSYYLHRHTWTYKGNSYTAWFLATTPSGYPPKGDPFWSHYEPTLGPLKAAQGAKGQATFIRPGAFNHGFVAIASTSSDTTFRYFGTRPERWKGSSIWLHGYWRHAWADRHVPIKTIDTSTKTITLTEKPGYGIAAGQPYYAENLPEEISTPGEWYIDRGRGILYLWPPHLLAGSEVMVSMLEDPLVHLEKGTHDVEFYDLTLEAGRATLVVIDGGNHNRLVHCTLRNAGTNGAIIKGEDNGLDHCTISETGDSGVKLRGGDRASLKRAKNFVRDTRIHHFGRWSWTYHPGVSVSGCGHEVVHNVFHDAPHTAILYSGNEHLFEFNEIHDVCRFSSDAGAIYAGRDWGYRGNIIRYNFIHHISTSLDGYGVHGIYLDDCLSGIHVFGNILYKIQGLGVLNGGGRDNIIENNIFARCGKALNGDSRGIKAINNKPGDSWNFLERLRRDHIDYKVDPWAKAYPLLAKIPNSWTAISNPTALWRYPQGCVFSRNIGFANGKWATESNYGGTGTFDKYKEIKDNIEDKDPLFRDESKLDLSLKAGSPALTIPGFKKIPFDKIGVRP